MLFRYRLVDESGKDLGPLASKRSDWSAGDVVSRWHGEDLVVVRVVPAEPDEAIHAYVVARPCAQEQPSGRRTAPRAAQT